MLSDTQSRVLRSIGALPNPREEFDPLAAAMEDPMPPMREAERQLNNTLNLTPWGYMALRKDATVEHELPALTVAANELAARVDADTTAEQVLTWAAEAYRVRPRDVRNGCRDKATTRARWVASYVMRHRLAMSFPAIARVIGAANHSTVISAVQRMERVA